MTTRSHCGRHAVACALVAIVAVAVPVAGKPHERFTQDDYARAMLAQYFPAAASPSVIELTPTELPEPASFRSSRSDDRWAGALTPPVLARPLPVAAARPPTLVGRLDGVQPEQSVADVHAAVAAVAVPCKAAVADRARGNDTSSAVTVEKLAAFYEQLKNQQETLVRQQFQQQLYEQQQRRQQEFALVQQQIQQQYYQQQQQAMLMLDQMRKNPAFVRQLSAFVDHKTTPVACNGTSVEHRLAAALPEAAAGSDTEGSPPRERDQTIGNHMDVGRGDQADDIGAVKRLDARQVARQTFASSEDGPRRATTYDDGDSGEVSGEDDTPAEPSENGPNSPVVKKIYTVDDE